MVNEVEHIGTCDPSDDGDLMLTDLNTAESIDLNDMPYVFGARYTHEKGCLLGTCKLFLGEICDVLNNLNKDAP